MKFILKLFIGGITFFLLSFVTLYLFTSGDYSIPKTVVGNPGSNSIEINNRQFYFELYGDPAKPLLVVLHGGPGYDSKYMMGFKELSDSYQVLFYDQLGCGFSERVKPDEISVEKQIKTLHSILEKFENDTVFLLGHSWGAMLATAYVAKYPSAIEKVMLIEPEYVTEETKTLFFESTNYMRPKFSFSSFSFLVKHWFRSLHIKEPDNQAGSDYLMGNFNSRISSPWHPLNKTICQGKDLHLQFHRFGAVASAGLVSSAFDNQGNFREEIFRDAQNYKGEVLILAGECNKVSSEAIQQKHADFFEHAHVTIIPDAGFFAHLDQEREALKTARSFFEE